MKYICYIGILVVLFCWCKFAASAFTTSGSLLMKYVASDTAFYLHSDSIRHVLLSNIEKLSDGGRLDNPSDSVGQQSLSMQISLYDSIFRVNHSDVNYLVSMIRPLLGDSSLKNDYRDDFEEYQIKLQHVDSLHQSHLQDSDLIVHRNASRDIVDEQMKYVFSLFMIYKQLIGANHSDKSLLSDSVIISSPSLNPAIVGELPDTIGDKGTERFMTAVYTQDTLQLRKLISSYDKTSLRQSWLLYRKLRLGEGVGLPGDLGVEERVARVAVKDSVVAVSGTKQVVEIEPEGDLGQPLHIAQGGNELAVSSVAKSIIPTQMNEEVSENEVIKQSSPNIAVGSTDVLPSQSIVGNEPDTLSQSVNKVQQNNMKPVPETADQFIRMYNETEKSKGIVDNKSILFVVQIAASRDSMSSRSLKKLYDGGGINVRKEEGWYKYQVGSTNDYHQAMQFLRTISVKGAFIVAYLDNEKLSLWKVLHPDLQLTLDASRAIVAGSSDSLVYVVQLLACRKLVSDDRLKKIYNGIYPLRMIEEEGLHKYQVIVGNTYNLAKQRWKEIGTSGTFLVPYLKGSKVTIPQALLFQNSTKRRNEP